ncbi:cold shock domain-containing protein [Natrinema sp. H-ect4]|uniref:cold shock domain-containing protein n=1 Tax=Natrinema sp. H-ect4 TaxID=3242699 RepID=UPI0035A966E0
MPKLHKYAASNPKDGFYIYARHNGQNVTYQVTSLARRIFDQIGYGDKTEITGEMLYTLHRLRLVYTNKSGVEPPTSLDEITDEVDVPSSAEGDRKQFFHTLLEEGGLDQEEHEDLTQYLESQDLAPKTGDGTSGPLPAEEWRPSEPDATDIYRGTVDFFNDTGGYGFIDCPLLEDDVFYHMEDMGGRDIQEGTPLEFVWTEAEKGPRATYIRELDDGEITTYKRTRSIDPLAGRPPLDVFQEAESYDADVTTTLLGTGGHWATEERVPNTVMLEREPELFLFDVGEGAHRQMQRHKTGFALDTIFLTATETDHIGGLGPLLKALSLQGRTKELELYTPVSGMETIESILDLYGEYEFSIEVEPVEDGIVYEGDTYTIEAFRTDVDGTQRGYVVEEAPRRGTFNRDRAEDLGISPGYDFTRLCNGEVVTTEDGKEVDPREVVGDPTPGRKLVYTGDVATPEEIPVIADDADLLIHEAAYLEGEIDDSEHATAKVAGEMAQKAGVDSLVLTNIAPISERQTKQLEEQAAVQFDGEVELATDGTTLSLPVPESTEPPTTKPAIDYGEPVAESDLEEGMYVRLTVDREKDSGKGLSKGGSVHIRNGRGYVDEAVTVKIVSKKTGYAIAEVETPSSGTMVYPYKPNTASSGGSKQSTSQSRKSSSSSSGKGSSGQKRVSRGSNPFKSGGSNHLRDLVRKKH